MRKTEMCCRREKKKKTQKQKQSEKDRLMEHRQHYSRYETASNRAHVYCIYIDNYIAFKLILNIEQRILSNKLL